MVTLSASRFGMETNWPATPAGGASARTALVNGGTVLPAIVNCSVFSLWTTSSVCQFVPSAPAALIATGTSSRTSSVGAGTSYEYADGRVTGAFVGTFT